MAIPRKVCIGPDQWAPVLQKSLGGKLGSFHTGTGQIELERKQPEAGKHSILLHELMHCAAEKMKAAGLSKRQPSEEFIQNMSGTLFPMLVLSGLWRGVSKRKLLEFLNGEAK